MMMIIFAVVVVVITDNIRTRTHIPKSKPTPNFDSVVVVAVDVFDEILLLILPCNLEN